MGEKMPQTFENHARIIPIYHMVCFGILAVNVLWALVQLVRWPSFGSFLGLAVACALVILFFFARLFALKVQDRLIRLEMRLRLNEILPADLKGRILELTVNQMVGLRFAPDDELPGIVRRVLDERMSDRTAIKKLIKVWNPDYERC